MGALAGLTPAGAGSTLWCSTSGSGRGAYPRRCGEHGPMRSPYRCGDGLPPQVRGAHLLQEDRGPHFWLTPAGAGSTDAWLVGTHGLLAYPRRCGEHPRTPCHGQTHLGLPPQVRGAREGFAGGFDHRGLTPAGAGSTEKRLGR